VTELVITLSRAHFFVMPKEPPPKDAPSEQDIRDAGPDNMPDPPDDWDEVDEASDESFPASDPAPNHPR
jgi:hypothetical protein